MLQELLLTPCEEVVAARDSVRFRHLYAHVDQYDDRASAVERFLKEPYKAYISTVSPAQITISLQLAVFLRLLRDWTRPAAILDLGSGFSSFAFRAGTRAEEAPLVYSVDTSEEWLIRTRGFLASLDVRTDNLVSWERFSGETTRPLFDLALLDMGDLEMRIQILDLVIDACRPGALIVIDDMHVPYYRRAMLRALDARGLESFSLRQYTRRRLRYAYAVRT